MTQSIRKRSSIATKAISLVAMILTSCGKTNEDTLIPVPPKQEVFKPVFIGDIRTLSDELAEGPFKIGAPQDRFASDAIKEIFHHYDYETAFVEHQLNEGNEVCDFAKVRLFSDEIDLSEFYWHHPDTDKVPLEKINTHVYRLTNSPNLTLSFKYKPQHVYDTESRYLYEAFEYSFVSICKTGEPSNNPSSKSICHTNIDNNRNWNRYEETQIDRPMVLSFFMYKDDLYTVSVQLFTYLVPTSDVVSANPWLSVIPSITVDKVSYSSEPKITEVKTVCSFPPH